MSQTYGISMARGLSEVVDLVLREAPPAEQLDAAERELLFEEGRRLTLDDVFEVIRGLAAGQAVEPPMR